MANNQSNHNSTRQEGARQEQLACQFLQRRGLALIQSNYLCKLGEIDLIMTEAGQFLVFIEVRYRHQQSFGDAITTVNYRKQQKIRLAAAHFLASAPHLSHFACRFDVIGVSPAPHSSALRYEWIRHAFM